MRASAKAPLTALAAASALLAACNKAPTGAASGTGASSSPAVATVNGASITRGEFDLYVKNLLRNAKQQPDTKLTPDQQNQVLDDLVSLKIMATQGEKDGVQDDPDVQAELGLLRMRVLADAESQKFIKSQTPSDADLKAEYEQAVSKMDHTEYHARHILVASKDQADQVIKKLKGGAKFEDLAKTQSTDSGSKNNGGDLGWFTTSRMVPPFANAVKELKKGEVTPEPVQTQYGWHVIKLEDTRDAQPPAFDNPQVKQQLTDAVLRKKLQEYVANLKKTAKVDRKLDTAAAAPSAPASAPPGSAEPTGSATPSPSGGSAAPASSAGSGS
jgi:peptidyl-prolyl cis-trans isomerase C